jgi:hypothetical protein
MHHTDEVLYIGFGEVVVGNWLTVVIAVKVKDENDQNSQYPYHVYLQPLQDGV